MKLNLRDVLEYPGGRIPLEHQFDFSDLELNFQTPAPEPVSVAGEVRNTAGVIQLSVTLQADLRLRCDRCMTEFRRSYELPIEATLAQTRENEENEDIVLIHDSSVDLEGLVRDAFILEMDMVSLCDENCKGLCPQCGQNLNEASCSCRPEPDPRLAALQKLL